MLPIHLNLGFRVFYFYEGFYFALAILAGTQLAFRLLRAAGLSTGPFQDALAWILLGALLGARLSHFVFWDRGSLLADPLGLFRLWDGGLTITGGLAGGVLAAYLTLRRHGADFLTYFAPFRPSRGAGASRVPGPPTVPTSGELDAAAPGPFRDVTRFDGRPE